MTGGREAIATRGAAEGSYPLARRPLSPHSGIEATRLWQADDESTKVRVLWIEHVVSFVRNHN